MQQRSVPAEDYGDVRAADSLCAREDRGGRLALKKKPVLIERNDLRTAFGKCVKNAAAIFTNALL